MFEVLTLIMLLFARSILCVSDPPHPDEIPHIENKFGVALSDPFFYFSNTSFFTSVKKYIDAENEWAENNVYNGKLVDVLKVELEKYESSSLDTNEYITEFPSAGYEYYKYEPLTGYGKWLRRDIETKKDVVVVLDETELFEMLGKPDFFSVARIAPSPDHKTIAFLYDTLGDERHTIGFRDVPTQTFLTEKLEDSYYGIVWSKDSKRILYELLKNLPNQPLAVSSYEIGQPVSEAIEVFDSTDDSVEVTLKLSSDREIVIITEDSFHGIRSFIIPLNKYNKTDISTSIREFPIPYSTDIEYHIDHSPIGFIVRKQNEIDSNFGVYLYSDDNFTVTTIRSEKTNELVTRIDCFQSVFYVWGYNTDTIRPFIETYVHADLSNPQPIDFGSLSTQGERYAIEAYYDDWFPVLGGASGYFDSKLKFTYSSLATPPKTYEFDIFWTPHFKLVEEISIKDFDSTEYTDDVIFVTSSTSPSVEIPVSVCFKKTEQQQTINQVRDRPVYVYTYGAYGSIIKPKFRDYMIPMLERNFVFAIAHVRGSAIRGMGYYHDGYRRHKKNTWDDLSSVLEYFTDSKIAAKKEIVIEGASAGGLTVGRTTVSRRDLINVTIATVPFVDVLNTMMDVSAPYTIMERTQWGDPKNDQQDFEYMHSYDPYFSLEPFDDYPNMYLRAGINDQRVKFWEPLKFMAKMRSWSASVHGNDLLKPINTQVIRVYAGGHFGSSEGGQAREARAKVQAFVIQKIQGWEDPNGPGGKDKPMFDVPKKSALLFGIIFLVCICCICCICVFCIGFGVLVLYTYLSKRGLLNCDDLLDQFKSKSSDIEVNYDDLFDELEDEEDQGGEGEKGKVSLIEESRDALFEHNETSEEELDNNI